MEKWKKSEFQNTCVKIEHVTKRFGEDLVLKEVNLTLKVGQVYGVVGNCNLTEYMTKRTF